MRRLLPILLVVTAAAARAETVSVVLLDASGLSEANARKVHRGVEVALRELSGLSVREAAARPDAPRRGCGEDASCAEAALQAAGTDHAVLLSLRAAGPRLSLEASLATRAGRPVHRKVDGANLDAPEAAVKSLVEAMLPAYARKGWGGVLVEAPADAQVKLDGKKVAFAPGEPLALTAGAHALDVLFPSGQAMLQRVEVAEGERLRVEASPQAALARGPAPAQGGSRLRTVSYGLWTAGAVAIAGSLLAGAASRHAAAELAPCQGTDRSCLPFPEAQRRHEQATAFAQTGNVLLGAGAALAAGGAGLFVFDLTRAAGGEGPAR